MFWGKLKLTILIWIGVSICIVLAIAAFVTALNREQIKLETAKMEQYMVKLKLDNEKQQSDVIKIELQYRQHLLEILTKDVKGRADNIKIITGPHRSLEEIKKDIETGHTLNEHIGEN